MPLFHVLILQRPRKSQTKRLLDKKDYKYTILHPYKDYDEDTPVEKMD
jgi:hypothetical protein